MRHPAPLFRPCGSPFPDASRARRLSSRGPAWLARVGGSAKRRRLAVTPWSAGPACGSAFATAAPVFAAEAPPDVAAGLAAAAAAETAAESTLGGAESAAAPQPEAPATAGLVMLAPLAAVDGVSVESPEEQPVGVGEEVRADWAAALEQPRQPFDTSHATTSPGEPRALEPPDRHEDAAQPPHQPPANDARSASDAGRWPTDLVMRWRGLKTKASSKELLAQLERGESAPAPRTFGDAPLRALRNQASFAHSLPRAVPRLWLRRRPAASLLRGPSGEEAE